MNMDSLTMLDACPPEEALAAADWIWEDHRDFYGIFGEKSAVLPAIAGLIGKAESDLGCHFVARLDDQIAGIVCHHPCAETAGRGLVSLVELMKISRNPAEAARQGRSFRGAVPSVPKDGMYLCRIAVAPHFQGQGIGGRLLDHLENLTRATGHHHLRLHVRPSNEGAVRLYRRRGFTVTAQGASYISMELVLPRTDDANPGPS